MALVSMPGTVAETFHLRIRDEAVAAEVNRTIGRRVVLPCDRHIVGIPAPSFGDTQYFVSAVKVVEEPKFLPAPSPAVSP